MAGADGKASAWATVFNLCNSAVGAGVLSFPMAFHLTGAWDTPIHSALSTVVLAVSPPFSHVEAPHDALSTECVRIVQAGSEGSFCAP